MLMVSGTKQQRRETFLLGLALSAVYMFIAHTHKAAWPDLLLVWLLGACCGGLLVAWIDKP
jgi:hypothetical protein